VGAELAALSAECDCLKADADAFIVPANPRKSLYGHSRIDATKQKRARQLAQ